jgi:hypothetical protein
MSEVADEVQQLLFLEGPRGIYIILIASSELAKNYLGVPVPNEAADA